MTNPVRIQLSRRKGWRMPPGTVKVDRTTRFGNPFTIGDRVEMVAGLSVVCFTNAEAVEAFRAYCEHPIGSDFRADVVKSLKGKNLACWCAPHVPCHADVLLEIANR